jgi:hypothetical protein
MANTGLKEGHSNLGQSSIETKDLQENIIKYFGKSNY